MRSGSVRSALTALALLAVIGAPFLVGAARTTTPLWLPLFGWSIGMVFGFWLSAIGSVFVYGPHVQLALVLAGEPVPWRRRFLRFAVDRSLLTVVEGEYRFVHLLVRDHLADCDLAMLAAAVLRRRAEIVPSPRIPPADRTTGDGTRRP